jgi:hypothetical protein
MRTAQVDPNPVTTLLVRAGPPDRAPSGMRRQLSRVAARPRLEADLRSIAIDLLGPNETGELPAACAEWVAAATQEAISAVCDQALDGLVRALESLLVDVPPDVARGLREARIRHDAGYF